MMYNVHDENITKREVQEMQRFIATTNAEQAAGLVKRLLDERFTEIKYYDNTDIDLGAMPYFEAKERTIYLTTSGRVATFIGYLFTVHGNELINRIAKDKVKRIITERIKELDKYMKELKEEIDKTPDRKINYDPNHLV